jgi:hypothetical protein
LLPTGGLLRQAAEAVTGHAGAAVFQQAARLIIAVCSGPAALLLYLCVCGSVGDLKTLHYRKTQYLYDLCQQGGCTPISSIYSIKLHIL